MELELLTSYYEKIAKTTARTVECFIYFHKNLGVDYHVKMVRGGCNYIQVGVVIGNSPAYAFKSYDFSEKESNNHVRRMVLKLLEQAKREYEEKLAMTVERA